MVDAIKTFGNVCIQNILRLGSYHPWGGGERTLVFKSKYKVYFNHKHPNIYIVVNKMSHDIHIMT